MKKYIKEIVITLLQIFMFYIFPLFAGPTDAMGMVLIIIVATFVLSLVIGAISKEKYKYVYPLIVAIVFIPSVWIHYNNSALIHSLWYLIDSLAGLVIGCIVNKIINRK